jgi:hypothetical protein
MGWMDVLDEGDAELDIEAAGETGLAFDADNETNESGR